MEKFKRVTSFSYNYIFDYRTGLFARWGKTREDDPSFSPFGPEILDIEVTTSCSNGCRFCYKNNTSAGKTMSLSTFKTILDKMPNNLCQLAFGADARAESNKDLIPMALYARRKGIIPNITVANLSDKMARNIARVMGAVAVSRYEDKNKCYDTVKKLADKGAKQVNIHIMSSKETLPWIYETMTDYICKDPRLVNLNAIVLLSLKKKGRGTTHTQLDQEEFNQLTNYAMGNGVPFGMDSCSASKFHRFLQTREDKEDLWMMAEPCESFGMFSAYINVDGLWYPCSFCENIHEDFKGIDVSTCEDFMRDVWNHPVTVRWRNKMIQRRKNNDFSCPIYEV